MFPALTCLFIAIVVQTNFHYLALFLLILWMFRLVILNNSKVIILTSLLSVVLVGILWKNEKNNVSILDETQTEFLVLVKPTSFEIDGELLQLEGLVYTQENSEKINMRYYIQSEEEKSKLEKYGPPEFAYVTGTLEKPGRRKNFDQFDYYEYLKRENIHYVIDVTHFDPEYKKIYPDYIPISYKIDSVRQQLFQQIDDRLFNESADYAKTLLFAHSNSISEDSMDSYRTLGLIHLLSISGLHIQLLISGVSYILLRLGVTKETTSKLLLIVLPIYGLLAGFGVGVFRSVTQAMIRSLSLLLNRASPSIDNWSIALILTILIDPVSIYAVGFQLSYLLSGALILLSNSKWNMSLPNWKSTLIMSLSINLISIPILSYHFFEFPWVSLLINVLFVPFFTWVLFPAIIIVFVLSWGLSGISVFSFIIEILNRMIRLVEVFLQGLASFNGLSFISGRLSLYAMIILTIGIILILCSFEIKKKFFCLFIGAACVVFSLFSTQYSPIGFVMMVDVGQGESIIIKEPFSRGAMLIDTGGQLEWNEKEDWQLRKTAFSIGEDIIIPVLKSQGVTHLSQLFLTHGDVDHIGELSSLANHFKIQEIIASETTWNSEELKSQLISFGNKDIQLKKVKAPHVFKDNKRSMLLLHPIESTDHSNEDSFVFYSEIGEYKWLFTGDIEEKAENELIKNYPILSVDILNVAHHGSKTSTSEAILNKLQPKIAMISAGENNTYGHPSSEVVERLENRDIQIYRTDLDGAIMYRYSNIQIINHFIQNFITNNDTIGE